MSAALVVALLVLTPWRASAQHEPDAAAEVAEPPPPGRASAEEQRRADDRAGDPGTEEETPDGRPDIPRRELPDYDGRGEPGPDAGEVLIWIPRVILWPIHAVVEYVLRRPIGWIMTTGEREHWDALQLQPITEDDPSWGVVPTVYVDFGFAPSGGIYAWFDDILVRGHGVRMQAQFGGTDWLRGWMLHRITLDPRADVEIAGEALMRPDYLFVGLGPYARTDIQSRYGRRTLEGTIRGNLRPWRASSFRIQAQVVATEMYDSDFRWADHERPISQAVAMGWYPNLATLPPGFEGYTAYRQRIEGAIDTREPRPAIGSGVRVQGHAELGVDLHRPIERRWLRWGGSAGAFWEIDHGRTLGLWGTSEFASALGRDPVPFTELPDLGGRGRMPAFWRGWITGESVIAASLEYRYPIWIAIDGFVNASLGNAFGPLLAGIDARLLRGSFSLGLRTVGDPDQSFTLQVGLGTATIEDGFDPVIVRLSAGMQEGF